MGAVAVLGPAASPIAASRAWRPTAASATAIDKAVVVAGSAQTAERWRVGLAEVQGCITYRVTAASAWPSLLPARARAGRPWTGPVAWRTAAASTAVPVPIVVVIGQ